MTQLSIRHRLKPALMACVAGLAFVAAPALGQEASARPQVDPNRLLEIMVRRGLVSREEADAMIAEAVAAAPQQAQALPPVPPGGVGADGVQTIPYVPDVVREQIVSQVRAELGQQAQAEGWSRPGETPEWTRRITLSGDIRLRGEGAFFEEPIFDSGTGLQVGGNYPDFPNFAAINSGSGFDVAQGSPGYVNPPYLNTTEDRRRARIRARLGIGIRIDEGISAELRLATGNDSSPVSTNQTLGSDGEFGKYALWVDRANIRFALPGGTSALFGRFGNPFWTSEVLFDEDLNFDGVAVSGRGAIANGFSLFGTIGAFPIFNTDFNFGSRDAGAFSSKDRWLAAAQAGIEYRPNDDVSARLAVGIFHFDRVQGELSSPCSFLQDVCDTDAMRPAFQQFGNSLFPLRNIIPDPNAAPGTSPEVQYFGLASEFDVLSVRGAVDLNLFDPVGVRLEGDFVRNLSFERSLVAARAINPSSFGDGGEFDGGDTGWQARLTIGHFGLAQLGPGIGAGWTADPGDWSVNLAYRRVASDAVLDAFTDSDLGLGGTNVRGWVIGGNYAFGRNTAIGARWLSSQEVSGPPLSIDRLFLDLTTRF
ncbi:putative porin [Sphingosinicella sp. LHD-64]|uniref:putative porin n=1 Tax=Sphingosinicella sp. LHD-64 TaxID=3072139 RepID=UPI00280F4FCD|nr:putative porin [Sphingosinicella sp. LHD-64]MDQ8757555.1 putative porin [Sphingosinicella sp. LHD-64]